MNNIASIILGLTAWVLPLVHLMVRKRRTLLCCGSLTACALSLLFQLREAARLTDKGDWSALMDTIHAVNFCAAVLVAVTLILNALALLRKEK